MQSLLSQTTSNTPVINERRTGERPNLDTMWDQLTLAQQFSLSSLGQFGYTLSFTRNVYSKVIAVLHLNDKTATINEEGVINITSGLDVRH